MLLLTCDVARRLLAEGIQDCKTVPSLAQVIVALVNPDDEYYDAQFRRVVTEHYGTEWPPLLVEAMALLKETFGE